MFCCTWRPYEPTVFLFAYSPHTRQVAQENSPSSPYSAFDIDSCGRYIFMCSYISSKHWKWDRIERTMKINSNTKLIGKNVILIPYEKKHVEKYENAFIWISGFFFVSIVNPKSKTCIFILITEGITSGCSIQNYRS